MATMMVQHKVHDFANWKKEFDSVNDFRKSSGELTHQIFHDSSDHNSLTLLFGWDSMENAHKFAHSPELRAAMEKAGVAGPPTITFLHESKD